MAASGPSVTDVKVLFARSGNRCAFPKCTSPIVLDGTLVGEVCHIKGAKLGSARHDPGQSDIDRNAYSNLILLCSTHHTVVDDDEEAYTVERLNRMKALHEDRSKPVPDQDAAATASLLVKSVANIGQSGGISAHTVNASTITVQSGPSTGQLTHQRQIQAVERLWQIVRNFSSEFSLVVYVQVILVPEELDAYFREGKYAHIADCVREYADMNICIRKFSSSGANDAANERPFVTQRLWSVFCTLQAIYGRSALLLSNSYKERKFKDWRSDSGCDQLLGAVLPTQAVEHAKEQGLKIAIDYLENQFLAEAGMNKPSA